MQAKEETMPLSIIVKEQKVALCVAKKGMFISA